MESTRERFLCGKDLNRLETSFVETSINVSLSLQKISWTQTYWFCQSLLFVTRETVRKNPSFTSISIVLEFQKPIILYQRRSFYTNAETAGSANMRSECDMEQQKKQMKQVRDATIFRERRRKEAGLEILVRDNWLPRNRKSKKSGLVRVHWQLSSPDAWEVKGWFIKHKWTNFKETEIQTKKRKTGVVWPAGQLWEEKKPAPVAHTASGGAGAARGCRHRILSC